jgi:outer membrane lipoprotein
MVYCDVDFATRRVKGGAFVLAGMLLVLSGCAPQIIPKELEGQVDRNVSFLQLKESPATYNGRLVVLGGEVLSAKRGTDNTRIEVLQIPLNASHEPVQDRTSSQGRFLALQEQFLDPATVPVGSLVTVVGEVTGTTTMPIDEVQYVYPTLRIRHVQVWENLPGRAYGRPPVSIGIGGGVGTGGGFGRGGFGGIGIGGGVGF